MNIPRTHSSLSILCEAARLVPSNTTINKWAFHKISPENQSILLTETTRFRLGWRTIKIAWKLRFGPLLLGYVAMATASINCEISVSHRNWSESLSPINLYRCSDRNIEHGDGMAYWEMSIFSTHSRTPFPLSGAAHLCFYTLHSRPLSLPLVVSSTLSAWLDLLSSVWILMVFRWTKNGHILHN